MCRDEGSADRRNATDENELGIGAQPRNSVKTMAYAYSVSKYSDVFLNIMERGKTECSYQSTPTTIVKKYFYQHLL